MSDSSTQAKAEEALARFREIEQELPNLLSALLDSRAYTRGTLPAVPKVSGVYLFTEEGVHRYVGRTRNANRRLGEHTRPKSPHNSAPFAFNIAKAEATTKGLNVTGTRKEISLLPDFISLFTSAKQRVRDMEFRIVRVADATLSTVFEVYASIALGTEGEFNLFETH